MSKYGAIKTDVDDIIFDSRKEANRYCELKMLVKEGSIVSLELQPAFDLLVSSGKSVGKYKADFKYYDCEKKSWIVEDVKGMKTPVYRLKKKIVEAVYGIRIVEI